MDSDIFWWNAVLLIRIIFIPFQATVLRDYPDYQVSVVFGQVMYLMGRGFSLIPPYLSLASDHGLAFYFILSGTGKNR